MIEDARPRKILRTLGLIAIVIAFVFPVYWLLSFSFKPERLFFDLPPVWTFDPIVTEWVNTFRTLKLWETIINSIIVAGGSTLLTILVGTPASYSLARLRVRGKTDIMLFIIASRMAPAVALIIPFFLIYQFLDLLDSHIGLILAYSTFNMALYVWLLTVMTRELPADLEGVAEADGYHPFQVFLRIGLPLMRPSIIAVGVLAFIFAWNEFPFALLLGGRTTETLPVVAARSLSAGGVEWARLAVISTVMVIPVAVMVFFLHKQIVRGLSMGAVRG